MLRVLYNFFLNKLIFNYFGFLMRSKLKKHSLSISGRVFDIGCGKKPYKSLFPNVTTYMGSNSKSYYKDALSVPKSDFFINDGTMLPFKDEIFDSIINFQVLPVFSNPTDFLKEVKRVTKINGTFLLTTDFLYPIWNAPYNYFRTTVFGLEHLAMQAGWEVVKIEAFGGYWSMQARLLDRYIKGLMTKLVNRFKAESNLFLKFTNLCAVAFWILIVLISPIFVNLSFILFHFLDKLFLDEDFTTNYLIILKKNK